jgi:hypothetical protein
VTVGGEVVDGNGPVIQIAEVLKALEEGSETWRRGPRCPRVERKEAELREFPRRLRRGGEWGSEESANQSGDERSPLHHTSRHMTESSKDIAVYASEPPPIAYSIT